MTDEKREKQREHERRYGAKDPERRREQKRRAAAKWRASNLEKARAENRRCGAARKARDPEAFNAKAREAGTRQRRAKGVLPISQLPAEEVRRRAYAAHERWKADPDNREYLKELQRKCSKAYREAHPEQHAAAIKRWKAANPERVKALQLRAKHKRRLLEKDLPGLDLTLWAETLEVFNHCCSYCLRPATELDHLHPVTLGGDNRPENCVPACRRCNASKHDKTLLRWLLKARISQQALTLFAPQI